MGDPHGVGPEVLLKSLDLLLSQLAIEPIIFGAPDYLQALYTDLGLDFGLDRVRIVPTGEYPYPPRWGILDEAAGRLALRSLRGSICYCRDRGAPLLVTAPVNKEALHMAGFDHPGQTEYVGSFFEHSDPAMAFFSERLNVLLVTVHIGLNEVFEELTVERMVAKSRLFYLALKKLGTDRPRIAFCGLNPHASENGLFGEEEKSLIEPALAQLSGDLGRGIFLSPYPADSIFLKALNGEFDGVVAHYHDQGLIPVKLVAFDSAVNATLGLPVVRVSPDHGTAFDIAGKGIANPGSMIAAIRCGIALI